MTSFKYKMKLLKGLCKGNFAHNGPAYVSVDITRRCNLKCIGCKYHSPDPDTITYGDQSIVDMPVPIFEELCRALETLGTEEVLLQGEGEPLLHPNIMEFISMAKGAGLRVTVLTNGTLLDEATCRRLVGSGLDVLRLTLWANTREDYEKNYPGTDPKFLDKVLKGLGYLCEIKAAQGSPFPRVWLHHPINCHNFQNIEAMVDIAHSTGCSTLNTARLSPITGDHGDTSLSDDEELIVRQKLVSMKKRLDALGISNNIDATLTRYDVGFDVWSEVPCYVGWFHAKVRVDGGVAPCARCDLSLGELRENTFVEVWNSKEWRSFRSLMITREGQSVFAGKECNCSGCCNVGDNMRVHSIFRWFAPFFQRSRGGGRAPGERRSAGI